MKPSLTAALVVIVLSAFFVVADGKPLTLPHVLVAVASAGVFALGAWLVPSADKHTPLVVGAVVAAVGLLLITKFVPLAVMLGIVGALLAAQTRRRPKQTT